MSWFKQTLANVVGTQEPVYGPSAIQSVAEQAKTVPWTELKKEDLRWAAMNSTCVETQTFYFIADGGHIGMAQVIYSNIAGLHTTYQFNSKIFFPTREKAPVWCSDGLSNAEFDPDRFSFHADGCAVTLNDEGNSYTIKSVVNEDTVVNITISQTAPGFHVGKDGKSYYGTDRANPWGSMRHGFWPRCHVEGSMITKEETIDFKGSGLLSHALQGMKPHHAAAKWNFLYFQSPTYTAVMMEYTTPPSYGSTIVNVGGIVVDGEILCAGSNNRATHLKAKQDTENDWPEPEEIKFEWDGQSLDGEHVTALIEGPFGKRMDRIDVMAKIPGFIKSLVGGVAGTKPYIYQYSPRPKLKLKLDVDGKQVVEEGEIFSEATFIL